MTDDSSVTPDPRRNDTLMHERDIRPSVQPPRSGLSTPALVGLAGVAALLLFGVLEARRQTVSAPATVAQTADLAISRAPPPLAMPLELEEPAYRIDATKPSGMAIVPTPAPTSPVVPSPPAAQMTPQPAYGASNDYSGQPAYAPPVPRSVASGTTLVVDTTGGSAANGSDGGAAPDTAPSSGALSTGRVRAAMLANRATTVPQGTLIPAVLETAFDSTNPGFARALVQFDVRGFDGTRILIPRGSRLIGQYGLDVASGQKRAVIMWTRLIRPDGVTIAIGSPAADPLGRGGVKADVDTHFFERFSGAILQSALDVGVALASRAANSSVFVALPGSINGGTTNASRPADIKPTLRVPAGRSVSVFVARDLDFTEVEAGR